MEIQETIQRLAIVLNALNNISVSGKANLNNLTGSINILEEVLNALNKDAETASNELA